MRAKIVLVKTKEAMEGTGVRRIMSVREGRTGGAANTVFVKTKGALEGTGVGRARLVGEAQDGGVGGEGAVGGVLTPEHSVALSAASSRPVAGDDR